MALAKMWPNKNYRGINLIIIGVAFCLLLLASFSISEPTSDSIELLVRTTEGPGGRRRGDIVSMKQLPHKGWGKEEGLPNYVIVKINDVKGFSQYHIRHGKLDENDISERPETIRSRFRFDLDNLSSPMDGAIGIQKEAAIANLIDRRIEILSHR